MVPYSSLKFIAPRPPDFSLSMKKGHARDLFNGWVDYNSIQVAKTNFLRLRVHAKR
jgi:hypothetical protein